MPGDRLSARYKVQQALVALAAGLTAYGGPWMIIGGIAVIARGVRRVTSDLDALIPGPGADLARLVRSLAAQSILPRADDAEELAQTSHVLHLAHRPTGLELDLSLGWTVFDRQALAARTTAAFGTVRVPMAAPEDLVIMAAIAGRPSDLRDAVELVRLYPAIDLGRAQGAVASIAALAEDLSLAHGIETIVEQTARAAKPAKPKRGRAPKTTTPRVKTPRTKK